MSGKPYHQPAAFTNNGFVQHQDTDHSGNMSDKEHNPPARGHNSPGKGHNSPGRGENSEVMGRYSGSLEGHYQKHQHHGQGPAHYHIPAKIYDR